MILTISRTLVLGWLAFSVCHVLGAAPLLADTRVLLIGKQPDHPWGTHMYLHTSRILAKCLEQTRHVEAMVSDGWPRDEADVKNVQTVVLYTDPAAERLLDGPHRGQFEELMGRGVGLVTIHWASSVKEENLDRLGKQWLSYLGGTWVSNVGLSTDKSLLRQLDARHPICRGWPAYELHDEFYLDPVITDRATPLLQVATAGKDVVVGWAYERPGGGRSYGTTLGHFYGNFQIEAFRRAVVNAILWTAHVEIPTEGAPVALSEAELRLPEPPPSP